MKAIFVLVTERKRKKTSSWKGDAHHTAGASKTENSLSRFLPGSIPCNWHLFSIFLTVIFPPTVSCLPQVCSFSCSLLNLGQGIQKQYRKNIKYKENTTQEILEIEFWKSSIQKIYLSPQSLWLLLLPSKSQNRK